MQISSVNNQNSFGLKFGPNLKADLINVATDVFKGEDVGGTISKRAQDIFEGRIKRIKSMFPNGILEKENCIRWEQIEISSPDNYTQNVGKICIDVPQTDLVLTRGSRKNVILRDLFNGHVNLREEILKILKSLSALQKEEAADMKNPVISHAVKKAMDIME